MLYGTGGIGKSTLACLAGKVAFFDLDESLEVLRSQLEEQCIPFPERVQASNWNEIRSTLQASGWDGIDTVVLDTGTKAEEFAAAETIRTKRHEKGHSVKSIEDYGYGKGFQFVFDTFQCLLGDLDRHIREGRNIIIIAHDCVSNVPNPDGEDWIRYEPRLQSPKTGNNSIRLRLKEWCDHVLFLSYDVAAKDGRAKGSGTRSLITAETPTCMAKSRTTNETFSIEAGTNPWPMIVK